MDKQSQDTSSIYIESESDQELNIHDIQNDIVKCKRLIRRSEYKLRLYKRKLKLAQYFKSDKKSIIEKGLELFNLKNKIQSKV